MSTPDSQPEPAGRVHGGPVSAGAYDAGESPAAPEVPAVPVLFSVDKGLPTPEELAAVAVVLAAASGGEPDEERVAPTRRERIRRAALRPRNVDSQRRGRL
ncbi:acyl-CoA carboxylase epsilon subunit [Sinomonas halotolerans]|uniref:Acyl-CoA carboxylase epsilon subunit n=1 Tax=Sinomonas halotolerans TaxID=1644133 RepID=A0ABU9WV58_9MICC